MRNHANKSPQNWIDGTTEHGLYPITRESQRVDVLEDIHDADPMINRQAMYQAFSKKRQRLPRDKQKLPKGKMRAKEDNFHECPELNLLPGEKVFKSRP